MAINVYTGVMGSGKTFEVVASVVVPAIRAGRRVVTNIEGISEERIHTYLEKRGGDPAGFGSVVHVSDARIQEPGFFPTESAPDAVVQGGDLVVIDEAWRFWAAGNRLSAEHMDFFRMHRHFVHPDTKATCDLALVFQSVTDISRALRAVVEMHFRMHKLKVLGLAKSYVVSIYEGGKESKTAFVDRRVRRYDKEIFPLYQSYAGGVGSELTIDKRQNLLFSKKTLFFVIVFLCLMGFGLRSAYQFFNPDFSKQTTANPGVTDSSTPGNPGEAGATREMKSSFASDVPLGVIAVRGVRRVVYVHNNRLKFGDFEGCTGRGISLECR